MNACPRFEFFLIFSASKRLKTMEHLLSRSTMMVLAFGLSLLTACTNPNVDIDFSDPQQVLQSTTNDYWRVSWFWDKDKDETHKFDGWRFRFREDGVFEAVSDTLTQAGTWTVQISGSEHKLIIALSGTDPLSELDDDWLIEFFSQDTIQLRDDNTDHLEQLHFVRQQ